MASQSLITVSTVWEKLFVTSFPPNKLITYKTWWKKSFWKQLSAPLKGLVCSALSVSCWGPWHWEITHDLIKCSHFNSTFLWIPRQISLSLFSGFTYLIRKIQQKWKPICLNDSSLGDCGGAFSLGQVDVISSSNNSHFFSRRPSSFLTGFWMTTWWITCQSHTTNGFLITWKITIFTT